MLVLFLIVDKPRGVEAFNPMIKNQKPMRFTSGPLQQQREAIVNEQLLSLKKSYDMDNVKMQQKSYATANTNLLFDNNSPPMKSSLLNTHELFQNMVEENKILKRTKNMFKSSTVNVQRLSHALLGMLSLALGGWQFVDLVRHGFISHMKPSFVVFSVLIHTLCSAVGVTRLKFSNPKERMRNNMIWPVVMSNIWFGLSSFTEWAPVWGTSGGKIVDTGIHFSMFNNPFLRAFSVMIFSITTWQVYEIMQVNKHYKKIQNNSAVAVGLPKKDYKLHEEALDESIVSAESKALTRFTAEKYRDSLWYKKTIYNGLGIYFGYLFWIHIAVVPYLLVSTFVKPSDYAAFVSHYGGFGDVIRNVHLNFMGLNNTAVFLATLFRYKVVTNNSHIFLPFIASTFAISFMTINALSSLGDGNFLGQLLVLIRNGIFP